MLIKVLFSTLFVFQTLCIRIEQFKSIKLKALDREIDISGKYVSVEVKFTLHNEGIKPIDKFYHTIPKQIADKLYHSTLEEGSDLIVGKRITDLDAESRYNMTVIEFTLNKRIDDGSKRSLILTEYYSGRYTPLPKKITLTEDQLVMFYDNVLFQTPYTVVSQQTKIKINSLIAYHPNSQSVERGNYIEYQSYNDIEPFTSIPLRIHQENNNPIVVFKKVKKTIEVSHWGNIAILEEYSLANEGAQLTGEFGRVSYNKYNPTSGKNALKDLEAHLPFKCWGIYYRDEIGNISTSHAARGTAQGVKQVLLELNPRFPILGGWRSNFQIGYNLPTGSNLQVVSDDTTQHLLTQDFGFAVEDMVAESYELEIILPEGATQIIYELPVPVDSSNETLTFSYLDTTGRPTLQFKKRMVSNYENLPFQISYRFNSVQILREPLMLFFAFFIFFMGLVGLGRLELLTFKLKDL